MKRQKPVRLPRRDELGEFLPSTVDQQIKQLTKMYRELLQWKVSFKKDIVIPNRREGHDRLLIIPEGFHLESMRCLCEQLFGTGVRARKNFSSQHEHKNERNPTETYAIWVSSSPSPDLIGMSDDDLEAKNILSMTLIEGCINQVYHWYTTGQHLQGFTVCAGSECDNGYIPCVGLSEDKVFIGSLTQTEVLERFGQFPMGARRVIAAKTRAPRN
ncbi:MAG: hypothetical protein K0S38_780 [Candidatus Paceibacter sp.]|jgi:hypothetical protein|nr:hypothetical protein [Candidatus Paceibacter sp.]